MGYKKILLWLLSLPLSYFAIFLFHQSYYLLNWVDFLFIFGLVLLVTGGLMYVVAGGFFSSFIHSCKVFFASISKKEQIISEIEGKKDRSSISFRKSFFPSKLFINFGLGYCILSLLLSILIVNN
jgi:ABC-type lipoprotein release transport system permease subunit